MNLFLTVVHVMACLVLIVVVLLQRGKGAEMGAVFGGGGSNTVFGSRGAASFLSKLTTWCTAIFFITSISLAYVASRSQSSLFTDTTAEETKDAGQALNADKTPESESKATGGFTEVPAAPAADGATAPTDPSAAPTDTAAPVAPQTPNAAAETPESQPKN